MMSELVAFLAQDSLETTRADWRPSCLKMRTSLRHPSTTASNENSIIALEQFDTFLGSSSAHDKKSIK
jgi:hypothetical protein